MSCFLKTKDLFFNKCLIFSARPEDRLSIQNTRAFFAIRRSHNQLPKKPAPPVIKNCLSEIRNFLLSDRRGAMSEFIMSLNYIQPLVASFLEDC